MDVCTPPCQKCLDLQRWRCIFFKKKCRYILIVIQTWGRLHANVIDYNYNYFGISWLLITITITFFSKCNRLQLQITLQSNHDYPLFTNYRCILITGVFRFLQMTVACDIIIRNFPLNIVYNAFFSLLQRKKAEMLFLRVSDLLLVCVVLNHDADSSLYSIKNDIFIENKWEIAVGKVCLLVVKDFDSLVPCLKTENDVKLCISTWVTLCPNYLKGVDIKRATYVLSCLSTPFWCTLWKGICPI